MIANYSKGCRLKSHKNYKDVTCIKSKISFIICVVLAMIISQNKASANSLEEVDDKELSKLISQEQYVAVLFSKYPSFDPYSKNKSTDSPANFQCSL